MAIVLRQIHVQAVENILDDKTINSEQVCGSIIESSLTTAASRKGLWLVDSIIMAIVLRQIHVQAVENILDDKTINSEQVCGSIIESSLTTAASRKGLWLVDSIIMAIVLCQIHMQAVENIILDDQTTNSEQV